MTQLPKLFGVKGGEVLLRRIAILGSQIPDTNVAVLTFGLVAIVVMVLGEKILTPAGRSRWV